jgi:Tfp pilus assembly protein PilF
MLRPGWIRLSAMLLVASGAAAAAGTDDGRYIAGIERAIAAGRLTQVEAMLNVPDAITNPVERQRLAASFLLARHEDEKAADLFGVLAQSMPHDCRVEEGAATAAMRLRRYEQAGSLLASVTVACPDRALAWGHLAILYDIQGRWDASAAAHHQALALDPDNPALLNNAGASMFAQRRFREARDYFQRAVQRDPVTERYRNNLDIAIVAGGKAPAIDDESDPERRSLRLNNAGYAAWLVDDRTTAEAYFNKSIETSAYRFRAAETNLDGLTGKVAP